MFEFRGDWFNASAITCIEVSDDEVKIHVYNREEPFCYSSDDEDDARRDQKEAVLAWKAALSVMPHS